MKADAGKLMIKAIKDCYCYEDKENCTEEKLQKAGVLLINHMIWLIKLKL